MPDPGDAHPQVWQKLHHLGLGHYLRFDPRRREQEIHDRCSWLGRERESDRREPSNGFLFDDGFDAVLTGLKLVDEGLRLRVGGQRDGKIRISREPWLGANGNGQAADDRERDVSLGEVGADSTEGRFERCHPSLVPTSTDRPGQSPDSAPGRSRSHWRSRRSISSSSASG